VTDEEAAAAKDEVLEGLHAKLFVIDRGWKASVFSGSFNATVHALRHNVEFMVELVGKRSQFGVEQFLRQAKGEMNFADLLKDYDVNAPLVPADAASQEFDNLLLAIKRALAAAAPHLKAAPSDEKDLFDLRLEWESAPKWPDAAAEMRAWPITLPADAGQSLTKAVVFPRLSYIGLTPLIAFSVTAQFGGTERKSVFVMNLPVKGLPEDRQDRVVRSLIENRDQLIRYILFLLACGDEAAASGDPRRLLQSSGDGANGSPHTPYLLETMLRALHRSPAQLERVESLLGALRKQAGSSELLSDDFQKVWEPIWNAAQKAVTK
jgi:hypothetical protein